MKGMGATNMENSSIDYRERSPLVVPPKLDLPQPASPRPKRTRRTGRRTRTKQRRKAAIAARKKDKNNTKRELPRRGPSADAERTQRRAHAGTIRTVQDPIARRAASDANPLSPSQLGYDGGFMGMFNGNKAESTEFKAEPTARVAGPAAAGLSDAVAELRLRHRPEGIPEQGITTRLQAGQPLNRHGELVSSVLSAS